MQPETRFKVNRVAPELKRLPRSWFVKTQMLAVLGIPDYLGVVNGRFVALELKKNSRTKAEPLQRRILQNIRAAGGFVAVVNPQNWSEVYSRLELLAAGRG